MHLRDLRHVVNPDPEGRRASAVEMASLVTIRSALIMQEDGMKISRHLPTGTTLARRCLGLKGNRVSLLNQVNQIIESNKRTVDE